MRLPANYQETQIRTIGALHDPRSQVAGDLLVREPNTPSANSSGRGLVRGAKRALRSPLLWLCGPAGVVLLVFFVWPVSRVFIMSFESPDGSLGSISQYAALFQDSYYVQVAISTLGIAVAVTFLCLLLGYPAAHYLVRSNSRFRHILFIAMLAPLMVSVVVRTIGWLMLLGERGPIEWILSTLPNHEASSQLLFNRAAVIIGMTHVLLPFMILAIVGSLAGINRDYEDVATVLGAPPRRVLSNITWPMTMPGVLSGCILVFSLTIGAYLTPLFLGGGKVRTLAITIYDETMVLIDWPRAAALSMVLLLAIVILFAAALQINRRRMGTS